MTKYACQHGFDILVCAGGDGTLSSCLQGMINTKNKIPIGYIPSGSTNDFARSLGIPSNPLEAVKWIASGKPEACDVGMLNGQSFSYIVAFGAFTNVTYETAQPIKNILGHSAYILNGLLQINSIRSKRIRIECNGSVMEDDFIFGMVTNSSSVAGLLSMNDFLLDDGLFEVTLIKKPSNIVQLQQIVRSLINMTEEVNKEYIKFFRTDKIVLTSVDGSPISWTKDGEYGGEESVNIIKNHRKAVEFIVSENKETHFTEEDTEVIIFDKQQ